MNQEGSIFHQMMLAMGITSLQRNHREDDTEVNKSAPDRHRDSRSGSETEEPEVHGPIPNHSPQHIEGGDSERDHQTPTGDK